VKITGAWYDDPCNERRMDILVSQKLQPRVATAIASDDAKALKSMLEGMDTKAVGKISKSLLTAVFRGKRLNCLGCLLEDPRVEDDELPARERVGDLLARAGEMGWLEGMEHIWSRLAPTAGEARRALRSATMYAPNADILETFCGRGDFGDEPNELGEILMRWQDRADRVARKTPDNQRAPKALLDLAHENVLVMMPQKQRDTFDILIKQGMPGVTEKVCEQGSMESQRIMALALIHAADPQPQPLVTVLEKVGRDIFDERQPSEADLIGQAARMCGRAGQAKGRLVVLQMLLDAKNDPNYAIGVLPMAPWAVAQNCTNKTVDLLLKKSAVNDELGEKMSWRCAVVAVGGTPGPALGWLLRKDKTLAGHITPAGTLLHMVRDREQVDLLVAHGADQRAVNSDGQTALGRAIEILAKTCSSSGHTSPNNRLVQSAIERRMRIVIAMAQMAPDLYQNTASEGAAIDAAVGKYPDRLRELGAWQQQWKMGLQTPQANSAPRGARL
jgi:hypothetical protein